MSNGRRTGDSSQVQETPVFAKVLWRKQPFPDNFVPDTFLAELRTNSNLRLVSFTELVVASLPISQHFLSVLLLVALFAHLRAGSVSSESILLATTCVVGAAWSVVMIALPARRSSHRMRHNRRPRRGGSSGLGLLILCLVLLAVSPVLRTLTESTTSDSIWALSAILFGVHLALADYSSAAVAPHADSRVGGGGGQGTLSETLSLNAAICASVVLASRLQSNIHVFALLYLAISLFALLPMLRKSLRSELEPKHCCSNVVVNGALVSMLYVGTMTALRTVSIVSCALSTLTVVFLSFVCPVWMKWAQTWKHEIKGPWDPAEPIITSRIYT